MAQRSILITGCSSGIGLAAALRLHSRGYLVIATARDLHGVETLRAQGLNAVLLDLRSSTSINDAVDATLQLTNGTLDALFNNAGYGQYGAVEDLTRQCLLDQFETNLFGTHELTTAILPAMRRQGHGRIVQTSSVLGIVALPYRGAYTASKFALEALTDTLRLELHGSGIWVSLIEPGPITTNFGKTAERHFEQNIPQTAESAHRSAYDELTRRFRGESDSQAGRFRLGPDAVVDQLLHALESKRPKIRYPVTLPSKVLLHLRRLLPTRAMDLLARRQI